MMVGACALPDGFNPCFLGTCPQSGEQPSGFFDTLMFQSLFSWNLPSEVQAICFLCSSLEFQSLFSWNLPSEWKQRSLQMAVLVSILVFLELALRVDGILDQISALAGFNPCFLGTCPQSPVLAMRA